MSLKNLPNIGKTLSSRLQGIGIYTLEDLKKTGAVKAFQFLQEKSPQTLPLCYYLYSFQAALKGIKWTDLTETEKRKLRKAVGR